MRVLLHFFEDSLYKIPHFFEDKIRRLLHFPRIKRIILLRHGKTVSIRLSNTPDFIIFLCDGIARIENQ